jgi:hypothetical protein
MTYKKRRDLLRADIIDYLSQIPADTKLKTSELADHIAMKVQDMMMSHIRVAFTEGACYERAKIRSEAERRNSMIPASAAAILHSKDEGWQL